MNPEEARASQGRTAKRFGDVLVRVLKGKRFYEKARYGPLVDAWRQAAGEQIAAHTKIRSYEHGTLTLIVNTAALLHELNGFQKGVLLQKLRESPGGQDIAELRFCLGRTGDG